MSKNHIPIIVLLLLLSCRSVAQRISLELSDQVNTLADVWDMGIEIMGQDNLTVYINVTIRDGNEVVYAAQSTSVNVLSGVYQYNELNLLPQVSQNKLLGQKDLANGQQVFYKLVNTTGQVILEERSFVRLDQLGDADENRSPLDIGFSGDAHIYGQVSNATGVSSFVPQNYLRAELFPRASIADIPFGLDIFLSTEQSDQRQNVNQISLYFDAQDFDRSMRRKLDAKLKELEAIGNPAQLAQLNTFKDKILNQEFPDLNNWEAHLKDKAIAEGLEQLKQLESLESVLANPEIEANLKQLAALKSESKLTPEKLLQLDQLYAFASEIDKIKGIVTKLKSTSEQFEKYKGLQAKIDQAKRFKAKSLISKPTDLRSGLQEFGLMSRAQEIIGGFKEITIGTSFPYYSNLSLRSLSVNGLNVEWNPGKLYLATTIGQSAREVLNEDFTLSQLTLPQSTIAAKVGYGGRYESHLHLSYIRITDGTSDINAGLARSSQENTMLGIDGLFEYKNIKLGGEIFGSLFTGDKFIGPSADEGIEDASIPLRPLFGRQNATSAYDIAWKAFATVDLGTNLPRLNASIEDIGANYFSLGAPTLINDLLRWKVDLKHNLWNRQISISAFARRDENQLSPALSSVVSETQSYGVQAMVRVPQWPIFNFTYAPYAQNNQLASSSTEQNTNQRLLNITMMYPVTISQDLTSSTQLGFLNQDLSSNAADLAYSLTMYSLNQSINYKRNNVNLGVSYTPNQLINNTISKVWTLNLSGSFQLLEKWNHSLGFQHLAIEDTEHKNGFSWTSDYPINNYLSITTRMQRFIYTHDFDTFTDYRDFIAWGGVRVRW